MTNLGKRIAILLIEQDKEEKELISHLEMSGKGFKLMLENGTTSLEKLNKIADFFGIDVPTLLTNNSEVQQWKDKYYKVLEEKNKLLEEKNERLKHNTDISDNE